ncbi:hypothetical protein KAU32_01130 [bacterium]|nr:hypothetical protein [bacterium]
MKKGILKGILIVVCLLVAVVLLNASGILNKDSKRINSKSNLDKGYIIYNNKLYSSPFSIDVDTKCITINGEIKLNKMPVYYKYYMLTKKEKVRDRKRAELAQLKRVFIYLYIYRYGNENNLEDRYTKVKQYLNQVLRINISPKNNNTFVVNKEEIIIKSQEYYKPHWEGMYLTSLLNYIARIVRNTDDATEKKRLKEHIALVLAEGKKKGVVYDYKIEENEIHGTCVHSHINLYFKKEDVPIKPLPMEVLKPEELEDLLTNDHIILIKDENIVFIKRNTEDFLREIKSILNKRMSQEEKAKVVRNRFKED